MLTSSLSPAARAHLGNREPIDQPPGVLPPDGTYTLVCNLDTGWMPGLQPTGTYTDESERGDRRRAWPAVSVASSVAGIWAVEARGHGVGVGSGICRYSLPPLPRRFPRAARAAWVMSWSTATGDIAAGCSAVRDAFLGLWRARPGKWVRRLVRGISRRSQSVLLRPLGNGALLAEFARRLRFGEREGGGAVLLAGLVDLMPRTVMARFLERGLPVRRMEYERHEIKLVLMSEESGVRLRAPANEPFTVRWIESYLAPGEVFYDIGASIGPYTLIAAFVGGPEARVYAFEPSAPSYHGLCRNIALNNCFDWVTPLPLALSAHTELTSFGYRTFSVGAGSHTMGEPLGRDAVAGQLVPSIRLDDAVEFFGLPVPTHVKLDVDGPELNVLEGAQSTLADRRWRTLLVEIDRGRDGNEAAIDSLLGGHGFEIRETYRDQSERPMYRLFVRGL